MAVRHEVLTPWAALNLSTFYQHSALSHLTVSDLIDNVRRSWASSCPFFTLVVNRPVVQHPCLIATCPQRRVSVCLSSCGKVTFYHILQYVNVTANVAWFQIRQSDRTQLNMIACFCLLCLMWKLDSLNKRWSYQTVFLSFWLKVKNTFCVHISDIKSCSSAWKAASFSDTSQEWLKCWFSLNEYLRFHEL